MQPPTRGIVCIVAKYFYSSFPVVFMIINPKIFKNIIFAVYFLVTALSAQDLEDLSFGDENSLDIATWNI
ncbi:MAG TPA: hypothetical protein QGF51_01705, partial [Candidatus Marinimicrobia bacterium]|nr:hypothetical protein [Candidatus Neomarinimicrobiota bacterium]